MEITTIGLDIAKNVFQVHGVDAEGRAVLRRKVKRDQLLGLLGGLQPCLIGIEACATAHQWARQTLLLIAGVIDALSQQIRTIEIELLAWHRANATCRRLETIPGIGFITVTALAATLGDAKVFRSASGRCR